jgi:hypothetical protein
MFMDTLSTVFEFIRLIARIEIWRFHTLRETAVASTALTGNV